jgi:hypothetical protein
VATVGRIPDPSNRGNGNGRDRASASASRFFRRLVSYSLAADPGRVAEHALQFQLSVSSLRAGNARIPIVLFSHGPLGPEMAALCARFDVMVAEQGEYRDRLAAVLPGSGDALARYPVLHKQLNFAELAAAGAEQVLCCDLDTVFFTDVEAIFDRYADPHVVAREEVHSARSIHGADPSFIDESLIRRLAAHLGRAYVPPMNLGVVLYNHGIVESLRDVMATFVDDAWRLMCGLTVPGFPNVPQAGDASFPWMADVRRRASTRNLQRALPFPSSNGWIVEEVAWWLALGCIKDLRQADFRAGDVAQNGEVLGKPHGQATWALCHYYSHNFDRVIEWMRDDPSVRERAAPNPLPGFRGN